MFSQLRMREEQALLAQDYALETARAEGIEEGLKVGLVNLVRQGLLTPEVASQQFWTTRAGPRRTGKCLVNYVCEKNKPC